ncbi:MAG: hypothetical protein KDK91_09890 [Gammaproteobacteria bacterium]|nr:hypothetical protein [Gammaproteobacteria bacterium]
MPGMQRDWVREAGDDGPGAASQSAAPDAVVSPQALPPADQLRTDMRVAVLPFENLTVYPNAGRIAAELLMTELYKQRVFELLETSDLRQRLEARQIKLEDLPGQVVAAELAAALDVDAVLFGSVSEYGYQHGLREEPTVGLNLRLVLAETGRVEWAASHSEVGRGYLRRDSVNEAAQRVVQRMVQTLRESLATP